MPEKQFRRREVRQNIIKRGKLDEVVEIMDANNITVDDIQKHLEQIQKETSTFDEVMSRRQKRRANEQRRKALRLAQQKKQEKKKSKNASKKKTQSKTSTQDTNGEVSEQAD